ncbi:MAG: hypothetical protein ABSF84_01235 [Acidimicrobiales bacterium]|jgi:hypothetical protein
MGLRWPIIHEQVEPDDDVVESAELGIFTIDEFVGELRRLRRERDCLRDLLVDAGFSLRVDLIARCAGDPQFVD